MHVTRFSRTRRSRRTFALVVPSAVALALVAAPAALASGEGSTARLGVRNPAGNGALSATTQIIASNNNYGTRQSNKGTGGGAIYGCRAPVNGNGCLRASNLTNGIAFSFATSSGTNVGQFQIGAAGAPVSATATPFTTNAAGLVTNLNANYVQGQTAAQIQAAAVSTAAAQRPYAVVNFNGTTANDRGSTGSTLSSTGVYVVTFTANVSQCASQATLAGSAGYITSAPEGGNPNGVVVRTYNPGAVPLTPANLDFNLSIDC